jgi:hypothetical protein
MSDAGDAIYAAFLVAELLVRVTVLAVEVGGAIADAHATSQANKAEERRRADELMSSLLGHGYERVLDIGYFRNHTLCQRCTRLFATDDPSDLCQGAYHTYTPKLHKIMVKSVERAYGKRPPELFLPGVSTKLKGIYIKK